MTGAVQDASKLQEDAGKLGGGSAGRQAMEGLELVSRQFREQRLALWAAGREPDPSFTSDVWHSGLPAAGPDPSFTAMVF